MYTLLIKATMRFKSKKKEPEDIVIVGFVTARSGHLIMMYFNHIGVLEHEAVDLIDVTIKVPS